MRLLLPAWVALTLLAPCLTADAPSPGFEVEALSFAPPVFGVSAALSGGDLVSFDGTTIERVQEDGTPVQTYLVLPGFAFPSFVAISADETFAVVGENSVGDLFRIDLVTGGAATLANVPQNYDAVLDAGGTLWTSAFDSASNMNALVRVDTSNGATATRVLVPGFSGPVAVHPSDDLLFAVTAFPNQVLRFTQAQLGGAAVLGELDGALVTSGWSGISYMTCDQETGNLFLVENDFVLFADPTRIYRAEADKTTSSLVYEAGVGEFLGNVELASDPADAAIFLAFQPRDGGGLTVPVTDFAVQSDRRSIRPRRAVGAATGPGTGVGGVGIITFSVTGADPEGLVWIFFDRASNFDPAEVPVFLGPDFPPLFWGLGLSTQTFIPFPLPVDPGGKASFSIFNPGFLGGFVAMQAALSDRSIVLNGTATGAVL